MSHEFPLKQASRLFALALGLPVAAWAATPPDAGQTLQQLRSAPPPSAPTVPAPALINDVSHAEGPLGDAQKKVHVTRLAFSGNSVYDTARLSRVAGIGNADVSLADLRTAAHRVTQYYRQHGYLVARAYLPAQDVTGGVVTIAVLEGRLDSTTVNNQSRVSTERIQSVLNAQLPASAPLDADAANRALLMLQQTPGIGAVQGRLHPGSAVGSTALDVDVAHAPMVSGSLSADNYGNSFTGANRFGAALNVANLTGIGDQLSLQGVISEHDWLRNGRVAWDAPVGSDGLRLGAAWSSTNYHLGKSFELLDADGIARTSSVYGSYPIWLAPSSHVNSSLSLEQRQLVDNVNASDFSNHKSATAAVLTFSGDFTDTWLLTPASNAWRLANTLGSLELRTPTSAIIDALTAKTAGRYNKAVISAGREQVLLDHVTVYVAGTAQFANKNLDSSEQFFLGGPNGIRAYPTGEAPGDQGWQGTLEFRYSVLSHLQLVAFHDAGMVEANHHPYINGLNGRHLSGSGAGFNTGWGPFSLKTSLAWRGGSDAPTSDKDKRPQIWVQGSYQF